MKRKNLWMACLTLCLFHCVNAEENQTDQYPNTTQNDKNDLPTTQKTELQSKSGSRLKFSVLTVKGSDGSFYQSYGGYWDQALKTFCISQKAEDGKMRCLPIPDPYKQPTIYQMSSAFLDVNCTNPIFLFRLPEDKTCQTILPKYMTQLVASPTCDIGINFIYSVLELSNQSIAIPENIYLKLDGTCKASKRSPLYKNEIALEATRIIPASEFVEMNTEVKMVE